MAVSSLWVVTVVDPPALRPAEFAAWVGLVGGGVLDPEALDGLLASEGLRVEESRAEDPIIRPLSEVWPMPDLFELFGQEPLDEAGFTADEITFAIREFGDTRPPLGGGRVWMEGVGTIEYPEWGAPQPEEGE